MWCAGVEQIPTASSTLQQTQGASWAPVGFMFAYHLHQRARNSNNKNYTPNDSVKAETLQEKLKVQVCRAWWVSANCFFEARCYRWPGRWSVVKCKAGARPKKSVEQNEKRWRPPKGERLGEGSSATRRIRHKVWQRQEIRGVYSVPFIGTSDQAANTFGVSTEGNLVWGSFDPSKCWSSACTWRGQLWLSSGFCKTAEPKRCRMPHLFRKWSQSSSLDCAGAHWHHMFWESMVQ